MLQKSGNRQCIQEGEAACPRPVTPAPPRQHAGPSPWTDLAYDPEDFNLDAVGSQAAREGKSSPPIDDLVFDPADETLKASQTPSARITAKLQSAWTSGRQQIATCLGGLNPKKAAIGSLGALAVGLFLAYLYWEPYYVETKVLFIDSGTASRAEGKSWRSVEREVELLKNSEIMEFLAGDTYHRVYGARPGQDAKNQGWPEFTSADWVPADGQKLSESPAEFARWLQKELSFRSEISGGVGKVTLRLTGGQPAFLEKVMAAYVAGYADHRRMLESKGQAASPGSAESESPKNENRPSNPLAEQLQKIEMQQRGCQLALQFLDKGTGAFSGFVPDGQVTGISSLVQFQDRIVQLEIKKRSLEVQFTPESREIRSLDLEIQGLRRAMRECLVEQVAFLKKGRDQLLARLDRVEKTRGQAVNEGPALGKSLIKADVSGGQAWFAIGEGLFMLRDKPSVTKKPLIVKAGDLTRSLVAFLVPSGRENAVAGTPRQNRPDDRVRSREGKAGWAGRGGTDARKRADTKQDYWECLPASHFGRESLW